MVDIVSILTLLLENVENSFSKHLNFKIFWGACPLLPTFPVGTCTSKLIDSTARRLGRCQNVILFHLLLLSYDINLFCQFFLARIRSWSAGNEIIWSYLTLV